MLGLDWARIHFVENEGMAFGLSFGGKVGKLLLSSFRILMVGLLGYILYGLIKNKEPYGLLTCFGLIVAGAIGNILDSAFYGLFFSESFFHGEPAVFLPDGSGSLGFLQGKVVDMFYFPLFRGEFPEWFPFWGGERFEFFRPVFNIADSAISVGVVSIILFHRKYFKSKPAEGAQSTVNPLDSVIIPDDTEDPIEDVKS